MSGLPSALAWAALMGPVGWFCCEVDIFTVTGKGDAATVSANTNGVTTEVALRALAKAMGWGYLPATDRVAEALARVSVDLSFTGQRPRIVAHLIAVTADMDVIFDDRTSPEGYTAIMHVAPARSADTPAGRERLRKWAVHWYRSFLSMTTDPLVKKQEVSVSMHLGHLRMAQGDLEGAIQAFSRIYELGSTNTNHWSLALLRMAQSAFELGHLQQAEKWARELTRQHPSLSTTAEATVLVGKILLQAKNPDGSPRYDECVRFLEDSLIRLDGPQETTDIHLLIAEAHRCRNRSDEVMRVLDTVAAARPAGDWTRKQWLDFGFLRGIGAEGIAQKLPAGPRRTARLEEAIRCMELFLGVARGDPRRGVAFVVLGRGYLGTDRFLEARAAALEALANRVRLDGAWLQQARILEARTALLLNDQDVAFMNLETLARKPSEDKSALILFLVDSLIEAGRYQQAITNADLLTGEKGVWGDRARSRRVLAMFKGAEDTGTYAGFIQQAIQVAKRIEDATEQRKVAELIGRAYEAENMLEKAADAYRGILR